MTQIDLDKIYPPASSIPSGQSQPSNTSEDVKKKNAIKTVEKCGTASLIISCISLVVFVSSILFVNSISPNGSTGQNYGLFGLIIFAPLFPLYLAVVFGGPMVCGILLLISIIDVIQYKIRPLTCLVKPIVGAILPLIAWAILSLL